MDETAGLYSSQDQSLCEILMSLKNSEVVTREYASTKAPRAASTASCDGNGKRGRTSIVGSMRLEDIEGYFHLSLKDAAQALDISVNTLKRVCRKNGISKWPYREIRWMHKNREKSPRRTMRVDAHADGRVTEHLSSDPEEAFTDDSNGHAPKGSVSGQDIPRQHVLEITAPKPAFPGGRIAPTPKQSVPKYEGAPHALHPSMYGSPPQASLAAFGFGNGTPPEMYPPHWYSQPMHFKFHHPQLYAPPVTPVLIAQQKTDRNGVPSAKRARLDADPETDASTMTGSPDAHSHGHGVELAGSSVFSATTHAV